MTMKILRFGSRGPLVELLQLALTRAGYNPGPIDGVFGGRTLAAVQNFQRDMGLVPDGIVGPLTHRALMPWYTGYVTHTIRRGDTLYHLALQYGSTVRAIETANPGIDPLSLSVGRIVVIPLGFDVVPTNINYSSTLIGYIVRGLSARYPFLNVGEMGRSVMGRPLYYISTGSGSNRVFYNASHHANEWITTPLLLKFLEDFAKAYVSGGNIYNIPAQDIFNASTIYIAPAVNPDGIDLVTGELDSGTYFESARALSRNYPDIPFPSGWKANIRGVDTNLQYPAGWEQARQIKFAEGFTRPGPRDYVGSGPLVAPESLAIYDFTLEIDPALILAYHTQGGVIYWKFLDYNPAGSEEIGRRLSEASGYALEETPYGSGFAGYKDWFIQDFNRPGYTIEAGRGVNPLPISQFDSIYNENIGILTLAAILTPGGPLV